MEKYQELQRYCSKIKNRLKVDAICVAVDYELDVGKDIHIACEGNPMDIFKLIVCVLNAMANKEEKLLKKIAVINKDYKNFVNLLFELKSTVNIFDVSNNE